MSFKRAIHPCYRKNLPNIYNCTRERLVVLLDNHFHFKDGYDGKQIMQYMDRNNFCITQEELMLAVLKDTDHSFGFNLRKCNKLAHLMPHYWWWGGEGYGINKNLLTVRKPHALIPPVEAPPMRKSQLSESILDSERFSSFLILWILCSVITLVLRAFF